MSAMNIGSMMKDKLKSNSSRMASAAKSVGRSVTATIGNIIKCVGKETFKDTQDGGKKKVRYVRKRISSSKKRRKHSSKRTVKKVSKKTSSKNKKRDSKKKY